MRHITIVLMIHNIFRRMSEHKHFYLATLGTCRKVDAIRHIFTRPCHNTYFGNEDETSYKPGWNLLPNTTVNVTTSPWSYTSTVDARGVFVWAKLGQYGGGGYIVELGQHKLSTQTQLRGLFDAGRVDLSLIFGIDYSIQILP